MTYSRGKVRRPLTLALCVTTTLVLSCMLSCDRVLSVPEPPDLGPLLDTYENPTGELTPEVLVDALEEAVRRSRIAEAIGGLEFVAEPIDELRAEKLPVVSIDGGVAPEVKPRLVAQLRRTCRGPSQYDGPPDPDAHGRLLLTLVAGAEGILPAISGQFDACREHLGDRNFQVDGSVEMSLLQLQPAEFLIQVNGSIRTDRDRFRGAFDLRLARDSIEVRVPISNGDLVAGVLENGRLQVLRDRSTVWECSVSARRCENRSSGEVLESP